MVDILIKEQRDVNHASMKHAAVLEEDQSTGRLFRSMDFALVLRLIRDKRLCSQSLSALHVHRFHLASRPRETRSNTSTPVTVAYFISCPRETHAYRGWCFPGRM